MTDFPLEIQLDVDASAGPFEDVAYRWVDALSAAVIGSERAELAGLPATSKIITNAAGPLGPVGTLFGVIEVERARPDRPAKGTKRNLSDRGLAWLQQELADFPSRVKVSVGNLDETGQRSGDVFSTSVSQVEYSPGWLKLSATLPSSRFLDPESGPALQRRWLDGLRPLADQLNPGFGQFSYYSPIGKTALEWAAPRSAPVEERDPDYTIGKCRDRLRGYSWLTILAQELADRLGGADALEKRGAFAEVRQLANGGAWLLATEDFRDYTMDSARRIFDLLAPVLPGGMPRQRPQRDWEPPAFVVLEDPDDLRDALNQ
jgi:hypothetical protein